MSAHLGAPSPGALGELLGTSLEEGALRALQRTGQPVSADMYTDTERAVLALSAKSDVRVDSLGGPHLRVQSPLWGSMERALSTAGARMKIARKFSGLS